MSSRRLSRQIADHLMRVITVYEACGALTPKLWVSGPRSSAAEPFTGDGLTISEQDRARLLASMRDAYGAHVVGRADEVWLRMADGPEPVPGKSLESLADVDPTIRTGLLVCALDCRTLRTGAAVALQHLADDGAVSWTVAPVPGQHLDRLSAVLLLSECVDTDDPDPDALAHDLGWHVMSW